MFTKKTTIAMLTLCTTLTLASCGGNGEAVEDAAVEITAPQTEVQDDVIMENVKSILYTIPAPIEMTALIQKSGAAFNRSPLNIVDNVTNYVTELDRAVNLGIYGADLSYTSIFNQNQPSLEYLAAAKKLADDLGIAHVIDDNVFERMNNNMENKDSILAIVSESYWNLNGYLKENEREEVSAMVIAGGWIEGLYLASQEVDKLEDNTELVKRIAEQKYSLGNIVSLMESYKSEALTEIVSDFNALATVYENVEIARTSPDVTENEGTYVIGGTSEINMSAEALAEVIAKATEIRTKYIQ